MAFIGLLTIYAIEYVGMGNYLPILVRIPLFLSILIFIYVLSKYDKKIFLKSNQFKVFALFIVFTMISYFYAFITLSVYISFKIQVGYILLFVSTYFLLNDIKRINIFLYSMLIFHVAIIFANIDILGSGSRLGSLKAGYFMGDGNDFAWSLSIFLPFTFYFMINHKSKLKKIFTFFIFSAMIFGIIGTGYRGGTLAVLASISIFLIQSKKKVISLVIASFCTIIVFSLAPQSYVDRVHSIQGYQQDSSAQGRIMAWKAAVKMAIDNPLGVGAGNFNTAYGRFYKNPGANPLVWAAERWISPHSIYFLILGEFGFGGLILLLYLIYANYVQNRKSRILTENDKKIGEPRIILVRSFTASLGAYAVGGAFLGGFNYPHIYVLSALIMTNYDLLVKNKDNLGPNDYKEYQINHLKTKPIN